MTISTTLARVDFAGNGMSTEFPVPFQFFADVDLAVYALVSATGSETPLSLGTDFTLTGAGDPNGGNLTMLVPPPVGTVISIQRDVARLQGTDYVDYDAFPAESHESALDRLTCIAQDIAATVERAVRERRSEPTTGLLLPPRAARLNKFWMWDSVGALVPATVDPQGSIAQVIPEGGNTAATVAELFGLLVNVRAFGARGDNSTDDTAALNAAGAYAAATGRVLWVPAGNYRTTGPVSLAGGARGIVMDGEIVAQGGYAALILGDGGTANNQGKVYGPVRVRRATQSDWSTEADIGVVVRNCDACQVNIARAEGFTIGVRTVGDGRGFEDSTVILGRIVDNKIGLDVRTLQAGAWNNAVRYIGGHIACSSGTNPTLARFGVRFSREPGAYNLHNAHVFLGQNFELQRQGTPGTVDAIPFLLEVDGRGLHAYGVRMEQCSPFVARHTGAFNDATYEVEYAATYGFTGAAVQYVGATRAGGASIPRHQSAAAIASPRLIAAVPDVRAAAYRSTVVAAGGVGFEGLAVLSANPSGPPTTLNGFCFDGLASITLNANDVTLPTSRALAFVVDCTRCKEFVLAAEGSELRLIVMQFDASENVLTNAAPVLLSNMNVTWVGTNATWWEGAGDLDGLTGGIALSRHQRVTLHQSAAFAVIGVRGSSANAKVNAMRLFADAIQAPRVLSGGARAWGSREISTSLTWNVPSLTAGETATQDVTLTGVRGGDFVQAGFAKDSGFQNGGVVFHAVQGGTDSINQVRVTAQNITGGSITVGAGTLFVRATRPRL